MTIDTLSTLLTLIHEDHHLDVTGVTRETGLADVGLDSLAVAELLFSIEDKFKINLGEVEHDDLPATVGEVVAMIELHQSKQI
jgi:acyl carrier protein